MTRSYRPHVTREPGRVSKTSMTNNDSYDVVGQTIHRVRSRASAGTIGVNIALGDSSSDWTGDRTISCNYSDDVRTKITHRARLRVEPVNDKRQ